MITVPPALVRWRTGQSGDVGRRWLDGLPARVAALCAAWDLVVEDTPPLAGALALVVLVRRGEERLALRVRWPEPGQDAEVAALRAWDGRGAVRLVAVDPAGDALLLERLDPHRTLRDLPVERAAVVTGRLLAELSVPAPPGLPTLAASAAAFVAGVAARDTALGGPVPARALARARELAATLPTDAGLLVHGDLHGGNVLADGAGGWRAVDPKPLVGDPAVALAEPLWTRADDAPSAADLRRVLRLVADAAGLDPDQAAGWTVVRAVDHWLWGLEHGLTEDPVRCARLVDALA
ncbi:aminoglycoside phosphotransferase family protein [Microlunatus capsulatus]|uniref:Streptomycin 6-kinase n=1 Tax=Microlunatus capsulatus TaxID=99117 RepID=A0ABS4Z7T2_9ACTN|nr:aminoglycoside phosphotransferase family protein [Microlunatus capsulatus]MBP2417049.1 streptomycin 6-kinase [Microlunatus capsulatus]